MVDPVRLPFAPHCIYVMINMVKSAFLLKIFLLREEEFFLAKIHVIDIDNHNYNAVITRIRIRQEGLCRFCAERINESDIIISKSYSRRPKYFHKECAERINLL
jgi:hypothetical protein